MRVAEIDEGDGIHFAVDLHGLVDDLLPFQTEGIFLPLSSATPRSTLAEETTPPKEKTVTSLTPLPVSIFIVSPLTMPVSCKYLATQRMALPAIMPSEPSWLKMRIFASATSDFSMSTMPSPRCRSDG